MTQRSHKKRGFYTSLLLRDTEDIASRRRKILSGHDHEPNEVGLYAR